jgi:septal ring factor EnvC (AmiA/AmiB activator)
MLRDGADVYDRCEREAGHQGAHQSGAHAWTATGGPVYGKLDSIAQLTEAWADRAAAAEKERDELKRSLKAAQNDLAERIMETQKLRIELANRREDEEALSQALETSDMALKAMKGDRDRWERHAKDELKKGIDTARDMVNEITEQREKNRVLADELRRARAPRGGAGLALAAAGAAAMLWFTLTLAGDPAPPVRPPAMIQWTPGEWAAPVASRAKVWR